MYAGLVVSEIIKEKKFFREFVLERPKILANIKKNGTLYLWKYRALLKHEYLNRFNSAQNRRFSQTNSGRFNHELLEKFKDFVSNYKE